MKTVRRQEVEDDRSTRGGSASGVEVGGTDQVGASRGSTDRVID